MAPRPEHPEGAPTPVRTPVEVADDEAKRPPEQPAISAITHEVSEVPARTKGHVGEVGMPDGHETAPLRPQPSAKLARSVSNRAARPQRYSRVPPPDGGWSWMVLLGVVISNILIIGHAKTFGVYISTFIERFNEKPSAIAWIQSIQFFFFLGVAPIASMLAERFSPRAVTLCGAVLACAGMGLSSQAQSVVHLYFSYGILMGLACVFTFTPGVMMIAKYFDRRRGLANGLGVAGNSLGGIFMPIVADSLVSEYSLHGGLLIMGGILLNAAVGAMLWRPVKTVAAPLGHVSRRSGHAARGSAGGRQAANQAQTQHQPHHHQHHRASSLHNATGQPHQLPATAAPTMPISSGPRKLSVNVATADSITTPLILDAKRQDYANGLLLELKCVSDDMSTAAAAENRRRSYALAPASSVTLSDVVAVSTTPAIDGGHLPSETLPLISPPAPSMSPLPNSAASAPPCLPPVTGSTSVPDVSAPSAPIMQSNFEVQSQPSTSPPPPPLPLSSASQRQKERRRREPEDRGPRPALDRGGGSTSSSQQRSLDHQSIFSQSTASLSSFVYLSTFHLGPSYGTVEDITNLEYDDDDADGDDDDEDEGGEEYGFEFGVGNRRVTGAAPADDDIDDELHRLADGSAGESGEEEEDDDDDDEYDVYETVRARTDLKIDITGLLAATGPGAAAVASAATATPATTTTTTTGAAGGTATTTAATTGAAAATTTIPVASAQALTTTATCGPTGIGATDSSDNIETAGKGPAITSPLPSGDGTIATTTATTTTTTAGAPAATAPIIAAHGAETKPATEPLQRQGVKELEVILQGKKAPTPLPDIGPAFTDHACETGPTIPTVDTARVRQPSKRRTADVAAEQRGDRPVVSAKAAPAAGTGAGGPVDATGSARPALRRGGGDPSMRSSAAAARHARGNKYLDFSFFRSCVFYVMMVPLFLHSIGYPTIQMYTPLYARSLGFSTSDSARCLSSLAFADVIGRIGCAWLSDLHLCKRKYFYMAGMFLSGLVAYCLPLAKSYVQLLLCTSGFGLASGAYIGLTVALFADAFGNDKVAKAHSMATMCTGIAGLAGGPFIGYVLEKTESFLVCYAIMGSCQILGGLVYLLEPWAARTEAKKQRAHQWV